ncbi:MAG: hypothetical protein AAB830_01140 [Patescibacteria group bacterium]
MSTLRTIGVVGSAAALLLSATIVFAQEEQPTNTSERAAAPVVDTRPAIAPVT